MNGYDISEVATEHRRGIFPFAGAVIVLAIAGASWAYSLGETFLFKAVVTLAAAAIGMLILVEPFAGLWLFVFLMPTEGLFTYHAFTLIKAVGMVAFASFLINALFHRAVLRFDTQSKGLLAFVGWIGLSYLWAEFKSPVFRWLLTSAQFVLLWIMMRSSLKMGFDLRTLAVAYIAGTLAAVVASTFLPRIGFQRFIYAGWNPNHLARDLVISLILLLYYLPAMRSYTKLVTIGVGAVLLASLGLTQSRTGWLAAIVCIPVSISRQRKALPAAVLGVMLFLGTVMFSLHVLGGHLGLTRTDLEARWESIFQQREIRHSRVDIWRAGIILGSQHPILGVGAGGFLTSVAEVIDQRADLMIRHRQIDAHNAFIRVFAELGVIGLAIFLFILWQCGATIARQPPSPEKMVAWAIMAVALIWMMSSSAHFEKPTWFALFFSQAILSAQRPGPSFRESAME